jgi:hypothetical protein
VHSFIHALNQSNCIVGTRYSWLCPLCTLCTFCLLFLLSPNAATRHKPHKNMQMVGIDTSTAIESVATAVVSRTNSATWSSGWPKGLSAALAILYCSPAMVVSLKTSRDATKAAQTRRDMSLERLDESASKTWLRWVVAETRIERSRDMPISMILGATNWSCRRLYHVSGRFNPLRSERWKKLSTVWPLNDQVSFCQQDRGGRPASTLFGASFGSAVPLVAGI